MRGGEGSWGWEKCTRCRRRDKKSKTRHKNSNMIHRGIRRQWVEGLGEAWKLRILLLSRSYGYRDPSSISRVSATWWQRYYSAKLKSSPIIIVLHAATTNLHQRSPVDTPLGNAARTRGYHNTRSANVMQHTKALQNGLDKAHHVIYSTSAVTTIIY